MKEYLTTSLINASPEAVWTILTDGAAYAEWNPEIIGVDGRIADGARVKAHVRLGDGAVRKLPQRVTLAEKSMRMEWTSGLPFGLFVGRRTFTVTPVPNGAEFRMHLQMSGLLSGPIVKSVGDRQPEIDKFSSSLKLRAERR